ncbi:NADH-cytochrome b5 reductase 1-like protein [Tanacetum coccineum]
MDFLEAKEIQVGLAVAVLAVVATAAYFATKKSKVGSIDAESFKQFKLVKKTQLSHNVAKFRFALPTPTSVLGLPIGHHISCRGKDSQGEEVIKPYTPTTLDTDVGYFELVIKFSVLKEDKDDKILQVKLQHIGKPIDKDEPKSKSKSTFSVDVPFFEVREAVKDKDDKIMQVKLQHIGKPIDKDEPKSKSKSTFSVDVPFSIPKALSCNVKVVNDESPVKSQEQEEVAYEGEDEHEIILISRNLTSSF